MSNVSQKEEIITLETKWLRHLKQFPWNTFSCPPAPFLISVLIQSFMAPACDITVHDLHFIALTSPLMISTGTRGQLTQAQDGIKALGCTKAWTHSWEDLWLLAAYALLQLPPPNNVWLDNCPSHSRQYQETNGALAYCKNQRSCLIGFSMGFFLNEIFNSKSPFTLIHYTFTHGERKGLYLRWHSNLPTR